MMRKWWFLILILSCFHVVAQPNYEFKENSQSFAVKEYEQLNLHMLAVSSVSAILAAPTTSWKHKQVENYLTLEQGQNWLKFNIQNHQTLPSTIFITVSNRVSLEEIQVYYLNAQQDEKQLNVKLLNNNNWSASLSLPPHETASVFVYAKVDWSSNIQIELTKESAFADSAFDSQFGHGFAIGGMLCLSLAALFLFFGTGNRNILWLFAFFITRTLLISVSLGNNLHYLLPEYPELRGVEAPILGALTVIFYYTFIVKLFNVEKHLPKVYQALRLASVGVIAYIPLSLLLSPTSNLFVIMFLHFIVTGTLVIVGWQLHKLKLRLSLAITVISFIQLIIALLYHLSHQNFWFDQSNFLMLVGFWLHSILVIFLLSRMYRHEVTDKQVAQKEALTQAFATRKAQDELLALQNSTQEELEARVQERTLELNIALQELEQVNQELEEKNTSDELTSLYNRRYYDQKIVAEFRRSKRNLTPLSLLLVDIDYFKSVNDEYGHLGGDQCLIAVASLIKFISQRSTDIACRYGGEEFCIILPETDEEGARAIADKLRLQVEESSVLVEEQEVSLTISCGISTYRQESFANVETLFSCADKALYRAKNEGRNQVQFLPLDLDK